MVAQGAQGMARAMCQAVAGSHQAEALAVHATEVAHCPSRRLEGLLFGLVALVAANLALSPPANVVAEADDLEVARRDQTESLHGCDVGVFDPFSIGFSLLLPGRVDCQGEELPWLPFSPRRLAARCPPLFPLQLPVSRRPETSPTGEALLPSLASAEQSADHRCSGANRHSERHIWLAAQGRRAARGAVGQVLRNRGRSLQQLRSLHRLRQQPRAG